MKLHEHSRLARWILPRHRVAFTLGVNIYCRGEATAAVVAHELVHVEQAERIGTLRFHFLYVLCNLICGYEANPFEREARQVGAETLKRFQFKARFDELRTKPKLGRRRRARLARTAKRLGVGGLLLALAAAPTSSSCALLLVPIAKRNAAARAAARTAPPVIEPAAIYDGSTTWEDAAPCDDLADDLTYSVCALVLLPNGTPHSSSGRAIYAAAWDSSSTAYISLGLGDASNIPEFTHRSGSVFYRARSTRDMDDGAWHTLYGVADGTDVRLYIDGSLAGSGSMAGAQPSPRGLCTKGALRRFTSSAPGYTVSSYWQGEIAGVKTLDHAASTAEIVAGCGAPVAPIIVPGHGHTSLVWNYTWQPLPTGEDVSYFEVERSVSGLDAFSYIGDTRYGNRPAYDEVMDKDNATQVSTIHLWAVPWSCPSGHTCTFLSHFSAPVRAEQFEILRCWSLPVEGVSYDYRVVALRVDQRSDPSNVVSMGPQDPTLCLPENDCALPPP